MNSLFAAAFDFTGREIGLDLSACMGSTADTGTGGEATAREVGDFSRSFPEALFRRVLSSSVFEVREDSATCVRVFSLTPLFTAAGEAGAGCDVARSKDSVFLMGNELGGLRLALFATRSFKVGVCGWDIGVGAAVEAAAGLKACCAVSSMIEGSRAATVGLT